MALRSPREPPRRFSRRNQNHDASTTGQYNLPDGRRRSEFRGSRSTHIAKRNVHVDDRVNMADGPVWMSGQTAATLTVRQGFPVAQPIPRQNIACGEEFTATSSFPASSDQFRSDERPILRSDRVESAQIRRRTDDAKADRHEFAATNPPASGGGSHFSGRCWP
jgi:hypothetical protein